MKALAALMLTILASTPLLAGQNHVSNPYLPYPPSCARMPDTNAAGGLESQGVKFEEREILLDAAGASQPVPLTVRAYRAACSEPNRSLVWLEFELSAQYADDDLQISLPYALAEIAPNYRKPMRLAGEPNGWGSNELIDLNANFLAAQVQGLGWYYGPVSGNRRWVFVLDNPPPWGLWWRPEDLLSATEYNAAFKLVLHNGSNDILSIDVPATNAVVSSPAPRIPLSGRLSGNWIAPEGSYQGLLLSFSERVLPDVAGVSNGAERPMVVFLAHFTYDTEGELLWLTGAAEFEPGAAQVTIPIELVTNGEFRSNKRADRRLIGSVTLSSRSCNDLGFVYDYSGVGLGSGQRRLERLETLETAGHDCRDYAAKVAAIR